MKGTFPPRINAGPWTGLILVKPIGQEVEPEVNLNSFMSLYCQALPSNQHPVNADSAQEHRQTTTGSEHAVEVHPHRRSTPGGAASRDDILPVPLGSICESGQDDLLGKLLPSVVIIWSKEKLAWMEVYGLIRERSYYNY